MVARLDWRFTCNVAAELHIELESLSLCGENNKLPNLIIKLNAAEEYFRYAKAISVSDKDSFRKPHPGPENIVLCQAETAAEVIGENNSTTTQPIT